MLSNGAFILTDYQPAATAFELAKNPDYYDADSISLDGLAYQVIKDSQQALMSYQTGALDMTLLNGEQVDQVKDDPEFTSVGAGYLWYISPNVDGVPDLANLNLRKAMTFALDRDAITGDVLKDGSTPAYTAVPAQFATSPDGSDFSADQTKFADSCAYDPDKAKEFYEAAKAELGKDSFTFDMIVDADDAPQKVAQVVKEQLETTLGPGRQPDHGAEEPAARRSRRAPPPAGARPSRGGPYCPDPMSGQGGRATTPTPPRAGEAPPPTQPPRAHHR